MTEPTQEQIEAMRQTVAEHDRRIATERQAQLDAVYQPVVAILSSQAYADTKAAVAAALSAMPSEEENLRLSLRAVAMSLDTLHQNIAVKAAHLLVSQSPVDPVPEEPED